MMMLGLGGVCFCVWGVYDVCFVMKKKFGNCVVFIYEIIGIKISPPTKKMYEYYYLPRTIRAMTHSNVIPSKSAIVVRVGALPAAGSIPYRSIITLNPMPRKTCKKIIEFVITKKRERKRKVSKTYAHSNDTPHRHRYCERRFRVVWIFNEYL